MIRHWPQFGVALLLFALAGLGSTQPVQADGTFISAPNRVDMVHDAKRNILYITSGSQVLRYNLKAQQFLTPFQLGGNLRGTDLSPDGNTLAVADESYSGSQVWIYLVDLSTGTSRQVTFVRAFYEGGTYTVAYSNDGNILITSTFLGSGWVPLRRYNPKTGVTTKLWTVMQNTMLSRSADGSIIGFAEANISDGRWGRYRVGDGNLVERTYTDGTGWFNYEIGTNRNGTQFAIPTYGGTFIYDSNFAKIATLGQYAGSRPIGVVYSPTQDIVYFAWVQTKEVRAFDTKTFTQIGAFNFEDTFNSVNNWAFRQGRMKTSRNGLLLFVTVTDGIRYVDLPNPPPTANDDTAYTQPGTAVVIPVLANDTDVDGDMLTVIRVTQPQYGSAAIMRDGSVQYRPFGSPNSYGSFTDVFRYTISDGHGNTATAKVTVYISQKR